MRTSRLANNRLLQLGIVSTLATATPVLAAPQLIEPIEKAALEMPTGGNTYAYEVEMKWERGRMIRAAGASQLENGHPVTLTLDGHQLKLTPEFTETSRRVHAEVIQIEGEQSLLKATIDVDTGKGSFERNTNPGEEGLRRFSLRLHRRNP